MDAELLARIQFGFTAAFHYIFPPLSIGLGMILVIMEGLYLKTGKQLYHDMTRFWVMVFAIIFGVGVATGITLEFQFGMNWSNYSRFVGDIFGSALAAEGIFAFFLESGFLGILVFGWNKVSKRMHFIATILVWVGSMFSAIWIVVANSWQQTPSAYTLEMTELGPRARITNFWEMVFNPSSMDRLGHVLLGAFVTGAMLVASVSAYYLLKNRHIEFAKKSMTIAVWVVAIVSTLQMVSGHISAEYVAVNQPTKFAAMEGHMDPTKPLEVTLIGIYNDETQSVDGIVIPGMIDFLLSKEDQQKYLDGRAPLEAKAAEAGAPSAYPAVQPVYQFFHWMIIIGVTLFAMGWLAVALLPKGRLFKTRWLLKAFVPAVALPHLANQFGWLVAELGRMPWTVYGLQTTTQGVSPKVDAPELWMSLAMFVIMYGLLGFLFIYLLNRRFQRGPEFTEDEDHKGELGKEAMSPLEAMHK